MKDSGQIIVNLLPPESDFDLQADSVNEKPDDLPDKPIIPPVVRLSTPYHSDIGDSGIESGSESDFSQRNIIFSHRNLSNYRYNCNVISVQLSLKAALYERHFYYFEITKVTI